MPGDRPAGSSSTSSTTIFFCRRRSCPCALTFGSPWARLLTWPSSGACGTCCRVMGCRKSRRFARQAPDWRGARTGSPRAQVRPGRRRHGEPPTRLPELAHPNCRPPELDSGRRRQLPSLIALDLTISGGSETYGEQMLTFIVSRESPQQFEYIKQAFSGEETV